MHITLKLFASLADRLPPGARRNQARIEVPDGATVQEVVDRLGIPPEQAHLVIVNGLFVPCSLRDRERLYEGDTLAIWPPVAGG